MNFRITKPMKKNGSKANNNTGNGGINRLVRFEFSHPTATAMAIAGTFNDWSPGATPMIALGRGRWAKELVLPAGTYEYLLVADGHWIPDPSAKLTAANPFGGVNSVLVVPDRPVATVTRQEVEEL